jgi:hypothetical protein
MHPCVTFLDAQIYFLFTNESHVWFVSHLTLPNFGHAQIMGIAKLLATYFWIIALPKFDKPILLLNMTCGTYMLLFFIPQNIVM